MDSLAADKIVKLPNVRKLCVEFIALHSGAELYSEDSILGRRELTSEFSIETIEFTRRRYYYNLATLRIPATKYE